jgi:hypothetical protein
MAESPDMFYGLDDVPNPLVMKAGGALVGAALLSAVLWFTR